MSPAKLPQANKEDFMSKREFTPEEIAESLSVCGKGGRPCDGCAVSGQGLNACLDIVAAAADLVKAQVAQIGELEAELTKLRGYY